MNRKRWSRITISKIDLGDRFLVCVNAEKRESEGAGAFPASQSFPENVLAPVRTCDDDVHQNQHQIVMPSCRVFSPEPGLPNEDFSLDRAQHDQYQTDRRQLRE